MRGGAHYCTVDKGRARFSHDRRRFAFERRSARSKVEYEVVGAQMRAQRLGSQHGIRAWRRAQDNLGFTREFLVGLNEADLSRPGAVSHRLCGRTRSGIHACEQRIKGSNVLKPIRM
jgi:hypothetical protein